MYKHYSGSGIGVRSLVDCYVFLKKYETVLNWVYIKQELSKLDIVKFEAMIRQVSKKVFSGSLELTIPEKEFLEECLLSGTYGTMRQKIERQMRKLQGNGSLYGAKCQYVWQRLFPERKILEVYCPLFENFTVDSPRKYFSQNLFFAKWSKVAPSKCWVFITGPRFSVLYTI